MAPDNDICWDCGLAETSYGDPDKLCRECRKTLNATWSKMEELHNDHLRDHHGW